MKKLMKWLVVPVILLLGAAGVNAQDAKDAALIRSMVEGKNFIFKAQSAFPQSGRMIQLTSEFDFRVSGDSIVSYLPYFGRAYVAPVNPANGGINFTSTNFEYKFSDGKKEGWEIFITPHDAGSVQQVFISVFDNGRATLRVNDRNRQGISFNGYVAEGPQRAKKAF